MRTRFSEFDALAFVASLALAAFLFSIPMETMSAPSLSGGLTRDELVRRASGIKIYPYSGTLALTTDDDLRWNHTNLEDTLRVINSDYGLNGTGCELKTTLYCNIKGGNALRDYGGDATRISSVEAAEMHRNGLIEIGLHGYYDNLMDTEATSSPAKVTGIRWGYNGGADAESTVYAMVVTGAQVLRQILGDPYSVTSYADNGHRQTGASEWYFQQAGILAVRSGTRQDPITANWPTAIDGGDGSTATERGQVREKNRENIDLANHWISNYSDLKMECVLPFQPMDRYWVPHLNPPVTGNARANVDSTKAIIAYLAEHGALGVLTWHDQNVGTPSTPSGSTLDLDGNGDGYDGMSEILRFAAQFAQNTAYGLDGPKLQVLGVTEAVSKHVNWKTSFANQQIDLVGNFFMRKTSEPNGTWPAGYPAQAMWADSSVVYRDSTNMAGNGWFGIHGETGAFTQDVDATHNFKKFLAWVGPVPEGSDLIASVWATCDTMPNTGYVSGNASGFSDSLSSARIDLEIRYFGPAYDWADSTMDATLYNADGGSNDTQLELAPVANAYTSGLTRKLASRAFTESAPQHGWSSGGGRYTLAKAWGPFMVRDGWTASRSVHGAQTVWFFEKDVLNSQPERAIRWREFRNRFGKVPDGASIASLWVVSLGWNVADSDSAAYAGISLKATIQ